MAVAFWLLVLALSAFWFSTLQFRQPWRLLIWLLGAALLAGSGLALSQVQHHYGLLRAVSDTWEHRTNLSESVLIQAFTRNANSVQRFVPQLLDLFLITGAAVGGLAFAAFTRGQALERALRPSIFVLWGFMGGALAALAIVAIGFGGQARPRTFIGYLQQEAPNREESVIDGDTFWLGEVSLRLFDVDAPELDQSCREADNCGEQARDHLAFIMGEALVQCDQRASNSGRLVESFGRPLVQCWVWREGRREDIGERMIRDGYAAPYRGEGIYAEQARAGTGQGILRDCTLRPDIWRSREHRQARIAFERDQTVAPGVPTIGDCSGEPTSP